MEDEMMKKYFGYFLMGLPLLVLFVVGLIFFWKETVIAFALAGFTILSVRTGSKLAWG
jgi:hypothetical protein